MTELRTAATGASVVLVVEDEPLVRMLAVDLLEDDGFTVVEAADADEGLALARRAAAEHPRLAVLVASGRAVPRPGEMPPGARFFAKPYRGRAVVEHVRAVSRAAYEARAAAHGAAGAELGGTVRGDRLVTGYGAPFRARPPRHRRASRNPSLVRRASAHPACRQRQRGWSAWRPCASLTVTNTVASRASSRTTCTSTSGGRRPLAWELEAQRS